MINRLYTITGKSLSNEDTLTPSINAVASSAPAIMSAPSPAPILSSSCPPDVTPQPIAIPEAIAEAVRQGNQGPYNVFIGSMISLPYASDTTDTANLLALCNSMFPTVSNTVQLVSIQNQGTCPHYVSMLYPGTGDKQTSIPGVTVPQETRPPIGTPVLPIMPEIAPIVQAPLQQAIAEIEPIIGQQESLITGQIEQTFDNVSALVDRLPGRIGDQLVNTMGQIYGVGIGMGLDVPTMEEIETGTVNFNPPESTPFFYPGKPIPSPTPFPEFTPTLPNPEACPVPIVNVAPVCPAPPQLQDITFSPIITVNVPAPGMPAPIVPIAPVTVNVPAPIVIEPPTPSPTPTEYEPTPAPTPAPTPTPDLLNTPIAQLVAPTPPNKPPPDREPPAPEAFPTNINFNQNKFGWENLQACNVPASPGIYDPNYLWKWFGWTLTSNNRWKAPNQADSQFFPYGFGWIGNLIWSMEVATINQLNAITKASYPIANNYQDYLVLMIGGIVEKWVGAPVLPYLMNTQYNINYNNPQLIPGIPDLQNLFRKNVISAESFKCLVRANGFYDSYQMAIAESSTLVPSLYDIIRLHRGDKLTDWQLEYYANLNGCLLYTSDAADE